MAVDVAARERTMTLRAGAVPDHCQHRADECQPAKNVNSTPGRTLRTFTKRKASRARKAAARRRRWKGSTTPGNVLVDHCSYERSEPGSKCHSTEELTVLH
jgi:hypothetical protein